MNIEIQRTDKGAGSKRARYNSSMMDANLLEKGKDFESLPETLVIFITITENDVIGEGAPLYPIERCILTSGRRFDDGAHILYVNGTYRDNSGFLVLHFRAPLKDPYLRFCEKIGYIELAFS